MAGKLVYRHLSRFFEPAAAKFLLLVLLVLVAAVGTTIVRGLASNKAPSYLRICDHANLLPIWKRNPGNPWDGVDPAYPVKVVLGQQRFSIPSGYFAHVVTAEQIECGSMRDNISLQYWIPSLDAPERRIIYHGIDNRPKERSRPKPGLKESVVHVFTIGLGDWADRQRSASIRLHNPTPNRPDLVEEYGLWKTPPEKTSLETVYWFGTSDSEQILIECHVRFRCNMIVDAKDLSLTAYIIFARDMVSEHRTIVSGLKTLLHRWKTPTYLTSEPKPAAARP